MILTAVVNRAFSSSLEVKDLTTLSYGVLYNKSAHTLVMIGDRQITTAFQVRNIVCSTSFQITKGLGSELFLLLRSKPLYNNYIGASPLHTSGACMIVSQELEWVHSMIVTWKKL